MGKKTCLDKKKKKDNINQRRYRDGGTRKQRTRDENSGTYLQNAWPDRSSNIHVVYHKPKQKTLHKTAAIEM